ncbi:SAM-dependent methyltransferase [Saprospira sp. CCB-QB6]|uniref:THUMP-like domain-containing protein n=1 Tax=Saprospira sp. CCB-QB6 TaxID=3023936 RepID=UPI00234B408C|nr:SAM-dependent methyltransferase [Saprospira sp. CCB-QB6]WCL82365.1 SAM-dependent methyltransferase [Saprospira sp. CCB-QB6]
MGRTEDWAFIAEHQAGDLVQLALQLAKRPDLDRSFILEQINGRQKAKEKLPDWVAREGLVFPSRLSMQQSSSQMTAQKKAEYLAGGTLVDLTGGFGVDSYYLGQQFERVYHVEPQKELQEIVRANFALLGFDRAEFFLGKAEEFLAQADLPAIDCFYIDPSRRSEGQKVFRLDDCQPQLLEILPRLLELAPRVWLKAASMLDIQQALQQLGGRVRQVYILAWRNECKELLFEIGRELQASPQLQIEEIYPQRAFSFHFELIEEERAQVNYGPLGSYVYLPHTALLKAGAFKLLAERYGLQKLAPNSHVYSSEEEVKDFPGRSFRLLRSIPYPSKASKKLGLAKAQIISKNFGLTVEQLRKKLKIKQSGGPYLLASRDQEGKTCLYELAPLF